MDIVLGLVMSRMVLITRLVLHQAKVLSLVFQLDRVGSGVTQICPPQAFLETRELSKFQALFIINSK